MTTHANRPLADLLAELAALLAQQSSGTFFVATDLNASCRFAITTGKITHCTHGRNQGLAAIQSFLLTQSGSCSFSEQQLPYRTSAVVEHEACIALLGITPAPQAPEPDPVVAADLPASASLPPKPASAINNRFYRGGYMEVTEQP